MRVPENIRKVERPVNTVVEDSGRDGPLRYAVRLRVGPKHVQGGNPQPLNGRIIGHITGLKFVPKIRKAAVPESLSYGSAALVRSVTRDIFSELLAIYPPQDASAIMAIATVRAIRPSVTVGRLPFYYKRTSVCADYPGIDLSPRGAWAFLKRLGQDGGRRRRFYQKRLEMAAEERHHVAIDGALKQDAGQASDLSEFSYKANAKGLKDISVLYAYDIELMEPICAEIFPGNDIDADSLLEFISGNNLRKGIVLADKCFMPSKFEDLLKKRPELSFMTPIKRSDKRIAENSMLVFEETLEGITGTRVISKKRAIAGGRFLYSFKDVQRAALEEAAYLAKAEKRRNLDPVDYAAKKEAFGVIAFESNQDLPEKTAFLCHYERWMLEVAFARYKNDECLSEANAQENFSLIGSEFINFISIVATCRGLRKARAAGLLAGMSYGELMDDLSSAWRVKNAPEPPSSDDAHWVHTLSNVLDELEALGLSLPAPKPVPKKRGRPEKDPQERNPKKPSQENSA